MIEFLRNKFCTCLTQKDAKIPDKIFGKKIGKSSKTGQGRKSLILTLACFLTAITKV